MTITGETKRKFQDIVGADHVLDSDVDRFVYSYDASFAPLLPAHQPEIIIRPLTTLEVSRTMAIACEEGLPVTPRGAASGRTGGSIPLSGGISLSVDRMKEIVELDEGNMIVTAEAGVRTVDLYNRCAAKGLFYPPDPASWQFSTIGGNVAENAGGMRAVKYGVTANYVMGLEVVLADGTVLLTGGKAIKNVTGYDLKSLFTGSEGTLGVITRAMLRLIPLPKKRGTLLIIFHSLDDGCRAVDRILRGGILPAAAEIMDKICLQALARHHGIDFLRSGEACLIIEIDGDNDNILAAQAEGIEAAAKESGAAGFKATGSPEEAEELWGIRRGLSSAVASLAPDRVSEDISVPRASFSEMVRLIRTIGEKYRLSIAVYGHAGDGNLHPSILCDLGNPEEAEQAHKAVDEIFAAALSLGGTLSGEHGIGVTKRAYLSRALGAAGVDVLKAVKLALDPKGILNPGKIW